MIVGNDLAQIFACQAEQTSPSMSLSRNRGRRFAGGRRSPFRGRWEGPGSDILPVPARSGEGRLSEPTPVVQPIEASRLRLAPEMTRVVVAIDPAVTSGEEADETGIVVAGKDQNGHGYVLADISGRYRRSSGPAWRSPPTGCTGPTASWPRSTTAATWSGRRFACSTQTWRLPRSAPRVARSCGPNRWRRSTSRAGPLAIARGRARRDTGQS